jgi:hypothetical protein
MIAFAWVLGWLATWACCFLAALTLEDPPRRAPTKWEVGG